MDTSWTLCGTSDANWPHLVENLNDKNLDLDIWGTAEFQFDDLEPLSALKPAFNALPATQIVPSVCEAAAFTNAGSPSVFNNNVDTDAQLLQSAAQDKKLMHTRDVQKMLLEIPGATFENSQHILETLHLVDTCYQCNFAPLATCEHAPDNNDSLVEFETSLVDDNGIQKKRGRRKINEETLTPEQRDKRRRNNAASARFRARRKFREVALEKIARQMMEKCITLETELEVTKSKLEELEKKQNLQFSNF